MTSRYEQAGVSIDAGLKAVSLMKEAINKTHDSNVLNGVGAFGGLFSLGDKLKNITQPTLIASTDGVGTKVILAAALNQYNTIGHDIVNHCLNDMLCAGENIQPLFFLDYVASSKLRPRMIAETVTGMAEACQASGLALLGGETAEMPGVYQPTEFDVVGTIVGLIDQKAIYPRPTMQVGDLLLGLPSSGPHTNGYSLIRHIFRYTPLHAEYEEIGLLGEALLAPHRAYLPELTALKSAGVVVQAIAHITGGGLVENVPRALYDFDDLTVRIDRKSWPTPPLFELIQHKGKVDNMEMLRVFNCGIGMVIIIPANQAELALTTVDDGRIIGQVIQGKEIEWV
ncbi:phosphoribosylformylglycinamidine cyclo-ligase [Anaerolineales bacterium HSG6]|nr:phosphoribosylformylglycinamidine cyclo-ligase [Anaerolineales bacterium HSG6]MDM8529821.1 phosphoribosylformylglycinamidine cyclo-ligase [Anaerolineales bacterium HSG25]